MKRILVVDHEPAVLRALEDALEHLNYEVKTLEDPKNLFHELRQYGPDLLLLDFMLPNSNGATICHQLKSDMEFCGLPVIIMSGYNEVAEQSEKSGANDFIKKPFDFSYLEDKIKFHLKGKNDMLNALI